MVIKATQLSEAKTRTTKTNILLRTENGFQEAEIEIEYFSDTLANYKERFKDLNAEDADFAVALSRRIKSLPNVLDDNDKPIEVTPEYLSTLHPQNMKRIFDAIQEDLNPQSQPV